MPRPDKEEYEEHVARRTSELLLGKIASLPGVSFRGNQQDPIYGPVAEAINRAYIQGWIDSEIDFVDALATYMLMATDSGALGELWDIAQRRPETEDAVHYRRDWLEYDCARDQLKLAGVDPDGARPVSDVPPQTPARKFERAM